MMLLPCGLKAATNGLDTPDIDGIVFVSSKEPGTDGPQEIRNVLQTSAAIDAAFSSEVSVLQINKPCGRLIYSPTGAISDYDDVRVYGVAVSKGIKRAIKAGAKTILLVLPVDEKFPKVELVSVLAALETLYVPIQYREEVPEKKFKIKDLFVLSQTNDKIDNLLEVASYIESGRYVARDIGGGDPERMTAITIEQYVRNLFNDGKSSVNIEVVSEENVLQKEYPLFAAVNRAASVIERHRGRIIYLRYTPEGAVEKNLYLVGKGITYDTGGADIKINSNMVGMSRDKCGAAAVAGFMKVLSLIKPPGIAVTGALCLARNSVGENCYVSDEIIMSRSRARVRVGNTDAEGRMVMADVLCKLKEEALNKTNVHMMTVATLTGHACLTVGPYSIVMDNSVAKKNSNCYNLQTAGQVVGDCFEVSLLRKEDLEAHAGAGQGDDVRQTSSGSASSRISRGHQKPAGFLILASGLDKHEASSNKPLSYSHLDIAGSAGDLPDEPTAAPITALVNYYFPQLI